MFDVVQLAMIQACVGFGSTDTFNGANFSQAFTRIANVQGQIDGNEVRAMLCGRGDVQMLHGGSHYRLNLRGDK